MLETAHALCSRARPRRQFVIISRSHSVAVDFHPAVPSAQCDTALTRKIVLALSTENAPDVKCATDRFPVLRYTVELPLAPTIGSFVLRNAWSRVIH